MRNRWYVDDKTNEIHIQIETETKGEKDARNSFKQKDIHGQQIEEIGRRLRSEKDFACDFTCNNNNQHIHVRIYVFVFAVCRL